MGLKIVVQGKKGGYEKAIEYLKKDPAMAKIISDLEKSSTTYTIVIIDDGNDRYMPTTHTIYWDPNSALKTTSGGSQSPALGLGHEMDHANARWYQKAIGGIPSSQYDNLEEKRVITGSETHAARTIGEDTRTNHSGTTYQVLTSTSR